MATYGTTSYCKWRLPVISMGGKSGLLPLATARPLQAREAVGEARLAVVCVAAVADWLAVETCVLDRAAGRQGFLAELGGEKRSWIFFCFFFPYQLPSQPAPARDPAIGKDADSLTADLMDDPSGSPSRAPA